MKKVGIVLMLALFVTACNKNQKAVNKLEGTWNATHFITTDLADGETTDIIASGYLNLEYTFEDCKLKKEEGCLLHAKNIVNPGGPSVTEIEYTYTISEDGTKMTWTRPSYSEEWNIESLSSKNFIISRDTPSGEDHVEIRWEKE
ncbi:MAG: hypothetical protein GQ574_28745 [Crocinitomix sp.]|nr:hypothetical protein [Crocinitomix sp.]